jgi:hypothetical protein
MLQNLKDLKKKKIELSIPTNSFKTFPKEDKLEMEDSKRQWFSADSWKAWINSESENDGYSRTDGFCLSQSLLKTPKELDSGRSAFDTNSTGIRCNLELKILNDCIKNNKIEKIKCNKLFYDYIKCDELIKIERSAKYSNK